MNNKEEEQNESSRDEQVNRNGEGKEQKLECVTELKADSELFARQQKEDESLMQWWKLSEGKGSELVVINNLLYKFQKNFDGKVYQLVLPKCRRDKVLELAHDSVFFWSSCFCKNL